MHIYVRICVKDHLKKVKEDNVVMVTVGKAGQRFGRVAGRIDADELAAGLQNMGYSNISKVRISGMLSDICDTVKLPNLEH